MPIDPLSYPGQRFLTGATNDFSLFGGQPTVTIGQPQDATSDDVAGNGGHNGDAATPVTLATAPSGPDPIADPAPDTTGSDVGSPANSLSSLASLLTSTGVADNGPVIAEHAFDTTQPAVPGDSGTGTLAAASIPSAPAATTMQSIDGPASSDTIHDLTAPIILATDAFGSVQSTLNGTVGSTLTSFLNVADTALHTADLLTSSVITAADGFLGTDPVGGISTLVSIVDSADAFDLSHSGLNINDLAPTGPIIDLLADEAGTDILLGDITHHATGDLLSDHHDGGLGIL